MPSELEEITYFLETTQVPGGMSTKKKQILAMKATPYTLINGFLYKLGQDDILHRGLIDHKKYVIIDEAHSKQEDTFKLIQLLKIYCMMDYGG